MNEPKQSIWEKSWDWEKPIRRFSKRLGERTLRILSVFTLGRVVFAMACLVTLVALIYSVENWRGKRAWEARKKEMAARGVNLDWDSFVATNQHLKVHADAEKSRLVRQLLQKQTVTFTPPKFGAAIMPVRHLNALREYPPTFEVLATLPERNTNAVSVESLASWGGTNAVVDLDRHVMLGSYDSLRQLAQESGFKLVNSNPKKIYFGGRWLHERMMPGLKGRGSLELLTLLLKAEGLTVTGASGRREIQMETDISRETLRTWFELNRPWMEELFDSLRQEGLKLELDPNNPPMTVVQNFVAARTLAQTFATGAKLELLDGKPDRARFYLDGQESLMSFLSDPPHTFILAMIKVAVCGLHIDAISDGLRARAFRPEDLRRLRLDLEKINLVADTAHSWGDWDMLSLIHAVEKMPRRFWLETMVHNRDNAVLEAYLKLAPEGWYQQNLLGLEAKGSALLTTLNGRERTIDAAAIDHLYASIKDEFSRSWRPYDTLQRVLFPNAQKAMQTVAFNQSRLHMLIVAAALEEIRLESGEYPPALQDLVPKYLESIPNDVIDGRPLRYRLESADSFVLYSVGWNRQDEGGVVKISEYPTTIPKLGMVVYSKDRTQGDWVFRSQPLVREPVGFQ